MITRNVARITKTVTLFWSPLQGITTIFTHVSGVPMTLDQWGKWLISTPAPNYPRCLSNWSTGSDAREGLSRTPDNWLLTSGLNPLVTSSSYSCSVNALEMTSPRLPLAVSPLKIFLPARIFIPTAASRSIFVSFQLSCELSWQKSTWSMDDGKWKLPLVETICRTDCTTCALLYWFASTFVLSWLLSRSPV